MTVLCHRPPPYVFSRTWKKKKNANDKMYIILHITVHYTIPTYLTSMYITYTQYTYTAHIQHGISSNLTWHMQQRLHDGTITAGTSIFTIHDADLGCLALASI